VGCVGGWTGLDSSAKVKVETNEDEGNEKPFDRWNANLTLCLHYSESLKECQL